MTPWIRLVKPLLTYTPFQPVTAGFGQFHLIDRLQRVTYDWYESPGVLLEAQGRGSVEILEALFAEGYRASLPRRGRTSRHG